MGWLVVLMVILLVAVLMVSRLVFRLRINVRQGMLDGKISVGWLDGLIHIPVHFSIYADGPQWGLDLRYKKRTKRIPFSIATRSVKKKYSVFKNKRGIGAEKIWRFARRTAAAIRPFIRFRLLSLRAQIGLQDAAYTAMVCGGIQAIILGFCAAMDVMDVLAMRILPHYAGAHLEATAGCIVYLRPWHIILALLKAGLSGLTRCQPIRNTGKAGYHGTSN